MNECSDIIQRRAFGLALVLHRLGGIGVSDDVVGAQWRAWLMEARFGPWHRRWCLRLRWEPAR